MNQNKTKNQNGCTTFCLISNTLDLVEDTSNLNYELFLNLRQFRSVKWYMKYHSLFFTTFMYTNMHDGIDFDGFDNLTFEKKIFWTAIYCLF